MRRALSVCPTPGCPALIPRAGQCPRCKGQAEQARGTARQRGYDERHARHFRGPVLTRDPLCTCTTTGHGHGRRCLAPSTVADHYPLSRRELVEQGMDPNDPAHGRGLCAHCHNAETSKHQPGGWARA